tara:strand:- start:4557 stop:4769 length:213 start_codon:yes stop_codon:yes gene_type:complete
MTSHIKVIDLVRDDLQSVIFNLEEIQITIKELRDDFKEMNKKLGECLENRKKIDEELKNNLSKNKGWLWN